MRLFKVNRELDIYSEVTYVEFMRYIHDEEYNELQDDGYLYKNIDNQQYEIKNLLIQLVIDIDFDGELTPTVDKYRQFIISDLRDKQIENILK